MEKKIVFIGIAVVLIIFIPLAINLIILRPVCFPFVGEATDWLSFWGCYLGGVSAALVGFVTLYRSAERQKIELQISYKQLELRTLRTSLSECVRAFNYSRLCAITLYINEPSKYDWFISDLEQYDDELARKVNSWGLLYVNRDNETAAMSNFIEKYSECFELFNNNITTLNTQIAELRDTVYKHNIKPSAIGKHPLTINIYDAIIHISQQKGDINQKLQILFQAAQAWIKEEESAIEQLSKQL